MSDPSATPTAPTDNPERAGTAPFDATNVAPQAEATGSVAQAADAAQAEAADDGGVIGGEAMLAATSWGGATDEEMAGGDEAGHGSALDPPGR